MPFSVTERGFLAPRVLPGSICMSCSFSRHTRRGWFHRAWLVSWLAGRCDLPPSQVAPVVIDKTLSAYSRGGGCGLRPPFRIGPSTFPFDPQMLCTSGEPCPLFVCLCWVGCKVESDGACVMRGAFWECGPVQGSLIGQRKARLTLKYRNILWISPLSCADTVAFALTRVPLGCDDLSLSRINKAESLCVFHDCG